MFRHILMQNAELLWSVWIDLEELGKKAELLLILEWVTLTVIQSVCEYPLTRLGYCTPYGQNLEGCVPQIFCLAILGKFSEAQLLPHVLRGWSPDRTGTRYSSFKVCLNIGWWQSSDDHLKALPALYNTGTSLEVVIFVCPSYIMGVCLTPEVMKFIWQTMFYWL